MDKKTVKDAFKAGYEKRVTEQLQKALDGKGQSSGYNSKELEKSANDWVEKNCGDTKIKIWDSHNKQWLEPMAIFFDNEGGIWKIDAVKPGEEPLSDGWYDLQGKDLKKITITGSFDEGGKK